MKKSKGKFALSKPTPIEPLLDEPLSLEHQVEVMLKKERHQIWLGQAYKLYSTMVITPIKWPSITVQWGPSVNQSEEFDHILYGSCQKELNFLQVAKVKVDTFQVDYWKTVSHQGRVHCARIMPQKPTHQNHLIATSSNGSKLYLYKMDMSKATIVGPILKLRGGDEENFGLSWNPHQKGLILSSSTNGRVCFWDTTATAEIPKNEETNSISTFSKFCHHLGAVMDVQWHGTEPYLYGSVGRDCNVVLGDIRMPFFESCRKWKAHDDQINSIAFNPSQGNFFLTGSSDKSICFWDFRSLSKPMHVFRKHTDEVFRVDWSPTSANIFASASADNRVLLWDIFRIGHSQVEHSPDLLFTHQGHTGKVFDLSWHHRNPGLIASIGQHKGLHIWKRIESKEDNGGNRMDWASTSSTIGS